MYMAFGAQVHEKDIVEHYHLLKEYLLYFASGPEGLPDLEHHKARNNIYIYTYL